MKTSVLCQSISLLVYDEKTSVKNKQHLPLLFFQKRVLIRQWLFFLQVPFIEWRAFFPTDTKISSKIIVNIDTIITLK